MTAHPSALPTPAPTDLMRVVDLIQTARHDTYEGLVARELLIKVAGDMVTEIGLLRDTVFARGEDLEDIRAELILARSLRLEWPSIRAAINPDVHTGARAIAYLKARGWEKDHDRHRGEDWHDGPDSQGRMRFVFVPLDQSFGDWDKRMARLVKDLADAHGTGDLQVLADIAEAGDA